MDIRRLGISAGLIVVLFVAGVLLFNFVVMPVLVHQRSSVIVPDLQNMSETQAQKALERFALEMRVDRSEHHPEVPVGYIISHSPRTNDTVKQGRTIQVVLSLGPRTQRVPELKGMSLRQGRGALDHNRLQVGRVVKVLRPGDSREEVVATTPGVGEELVEGSAVDLVVTNGTGNREFLMPDLTGQDLLFIREKLRGMGFRIGGVRYEAREGVFPNTVIDQTPGAGALIREGDSIELVAASSD